MKLLVRNKAIILIFFIFFICITGLKSYGAQNIVNCVDPPGGEIICEEKQAAICKIKNGKVRGECKTPPENRNKQEKIAWILSQVMDERITVNDLNNPRIQRILIEGFYEKSGIRITFNLPENLR